ncbi:type III secretion system export apparatus subunit SctT [Massilia aquatica]|uniref:EscT/YscT/HrcT family type III secretion system export apparatus protein n=1 Tax=Massilia aquatica TaxID=2609000 RepID=A0ABX0MHE6_9BURK|nr:type III secretion system export apparatus subunit SctT [Massilia aquatica]NHZ41586.1 EscT/YscT/HrcT family type III secretion system export apparatus protein [Massilia aquatica]
MQASLAVDMQTFLVALALTIPRTAVCLAILPGFSGRTLQGQMRNAVAVAIALPAVAPAFLSLQQSTPGLLVAAALALKEAGIGLMLGVLLSIPLWVAQSIGSILDTQRSPIQIQSNLDQDASALGSMLLQAVVLVMVEAGLFVALVRVLMDSYGLWPALSLTPPFEPGHLDLLIKRFGEFFWHIAVYGGPVIIPLLMIDFGLAVIGIFAANLQVSFLSAPLKSLVGLFILLVYWPIFSHYVAGDFAHMLDFIPQMLDYGRQ